MRPTQDPQQRINEILDAAEYLFSTKGYEQTTIQDIARRMGVAQGTMYYYFKSKDKVMEGVLGRKAATILAAVRQEKRQPIQGYAKLSTIISRILQEISVDEGIFLNLMYEDQIVSFTNRSLDSMADVLGQEFAEFIGEPGSGHEIEAAQSGAAIFFVLETINNLIDMLCDHELSPQEVNARVRMAERIFATILACDVREIRIRLR